MGDMRAVYEAPRAVCEPSHQIRVLLRFWDESTLLTDKEATLQRCSEHFKGLLSVQCTVQELSLIHI